MYTIPGIYTMHILSYRLYSFAIDPLKVRESVYWKQGTIGIWLEIEYSKLEAENLMQASGLAEKAKFLNYVEQALFYNGKQIKSIFEKFEN